MRKKDYIERILELTRWVECNFTEQELKGLEKEQLKWIFYSMFYEFSK